MAEAAPQPQNEQPLVPPVLEADPPVAEVEGVFDGSDGLEIGAAVPPPLSRSARYGKGGDRATPLTDDEKFSSGTRKVAPALGLVAGARTVTIGGGYL